MGSQRLASAEIRIATLGYHVQKVVQLEPGDPVPVDPTGRYVLVTLVPVPDKCRLTPSLPLPEGEVPVAAAAASGYKAILARRAAVTTLNEQLGPRGRLVLARKREQK
jgi:hypothetical protein